MLLRVGTRGSKLSLIQTNMVVERITRANPSVKIELKTIATSGDLDRKTPLFSLSQKGIFEKEIDQAVIDRQVDFAVHSMKDIPTLLDSELVIASVLERGAPADVLVSTDRRPLEKIPDGKIIGTSSLLRTAELKRVRPGLRTQPIRGNVDTRIRKVEQGEYDAVILAEAGLARLGLMDKAAERLSLDDFVPAPGQGALALIARGDDSRVIEILKSVEHSPTRAEIVAERELVSTLEGGCKVPIGALASANSNMVQLTSSIFSLDGKQRLVAKRAGLVTNAEAIGKEVGEELLANGAKKIEETWRTVYS
jgi:hydroxymethylbilane synthase